MSVLNRVVLRLDSLTMLRCLRMGIIDVMMVVNVYWMCRVRCRLMLRRTVIMYLLV